MLSARFPRLLAAMTAFSLLLPSTAVAEEPATRMYSPGLLTGGIVLSSLGATSFALGLLTYRFRDAENHCSDAPCDQPDREAITARGLGLMGLGAAAFAGGMTMVVIGARQVPVTVAAVGPRGTPGASLAFEF